MNDSLSQCACRQYERLEGAATQAYITQFLQKTGADDNATYYQCRVCATNWKKVEESKRPSLVQIAVP
ncbi:MAG TPA: hypothetical protein VFZ34_26415 [Blastocatellia bacterium]|nr:hypothetical protein [Blastocatellia bacterium]